MTTDSQKLPSKTVLRKRCAELRGQIYSDAEKCGPLRGTALAMIDYAYSFTPLWQDIDAPFFHRKTEWIFEPDPWIALDFTHGRTYAIHVSLGVPALKERSDLPVKDGRYRNWSRFTVHTAQQLPSAMLYLEEAYFEAQSTYRKHHGKPKRA